MQLRKRSRPILAFACGMLLCAAAFAQVGGPAPPVTSAEPAAAVDAPIPVEHAAPVTAPGASDAAIAPVVQSAAAEVPVVTPSRREWYQGDPDAYAIVSSGRGLSLHKPMYLLPATYSEDYHGRRTEMLFQISLKQRLFGVPLYFGYTQKSFFDIYDSSESKPFRESDYNPELFYRWIPADRSRWYHLGADVGIEHESNGKGLPDSRSWNRLYVAPFQAEGDRLIYWKWWWRLPEDKSLPRTDPNRDDNPDIGSYYGYGELLFKKQFFHQHLLHAMVRYNPATGRGALNAFYSFPGDSDATFFWSFYLWQGYGESLIDYNRSITRIGVGVMLAR